MAPATFNPTAPAIGQRVWAEGTTSRSNANAWIVVAVYIDEEIAECDLESATVVIAKSIYHGELRTFQPNIHWLSW